ncbi:MAG: hypothetical protein HEEMFOPI_00569 [Holosporales bacterium]
MVVFSIYSHLNRLEFSYFKDDACLRYEKHILQEKTLSTSLEDLVKDFIKDDVPNCIAVQRGPSGFTNLRVTLAFVQGLAMGWHTKIFTSTHFDLLKKAYDVQNGTIIIDHKGATLPGVQVEEGVMSSVLPFSKDDLDGKNVFLTREDDTLNLSSILASMAYQNKHLWTDSFAIEPYFGILPTYKEKGC